MSYNAVNRPIMTFLYYIIEKAEAQITSAGEFIAEIETAIGNLLNHQVG